MDRTVISEAGPWRVSKARIEGLLPGAGFPVAGRRFVLGGIGGFVFAVLPPLAAQPACQRWKETSSVRARRRVSPAHPLPLTL